MSSPSAEPERDARSRIETLLGHSEFLLSTTVAFALIVGGIILLSVVVYDFARDLGRGPVLGRVLDLLSGLLLVFIFTELISTLRTAIRRRVVEVEPFLVVGIVAAIRRLIVVSAEAENLLGTPQFRDVMVEIAILAATALVLGLTVLILRVGRARHDEPPIEPPIGPTS
jgi:uncharacterized membrane protein (DUF373 family)